MLTLRSFLLALACFAVTQHADALDMNVRTVESDKFAYVNLWGEIKAGDDDKFRQLILPPLRSGFIIFKVNIFSRGGNVGAAMGIGDQIRLLQARTVAPYKEAKIINGRKVVTGRTMCSFDEGNGHMVHPHFVYGPPHCECASACFLIWSSGAVREGGHMGIHRLYWPGSEFGQLPAAQAKARYQEAQDNYTAYLKKLDVPQGIIDRLFATDSHSMYYLTWPEMQLMQSTPYIEEMVFSRCGKTKKESMSASNNWTMTEDAAHIRCYQGILREIMHEGRKEYLRKYGP
jgi:hypothetical protein